MVVVSGGWPTTWPHNATVTPCRNGLIYHVANKCIGNETKAAARWSRNCIRKTKKNTFCGTLVSVTLPKFSEKKSLPRQISLKSSKRLLSYGKKTIFNPPTWILKKSFDHVTVTEFQTCCCVQHLMKYEWFLSRVTTLTRDIDIAIIHYVRPFVRPPVCLSVRDILVLDKNGLTYCPSFFSLYGSPIILVLSPLKHLHEIPTGSPPAGR